MIPGATIEDVMEMGHGYQRSMALFTALRLDVFTFLLGGPADAKTLARKAGADPARLAILLDALAAAGLLRKSKGRYANTDVARTALAAGERSKRSILLHHLDCWAEWTGLERKIRGGRRGIPESDFQENFIRGMEDNARERADAVARAFPLRPGERVLDLGGGAGTYAAAWIRRYPEAEITVFDVAATLRVTRKIFRENGMRGGLRLREGDFMKDPLGGPYDFAWISQILHAFGERECVKILSRVRRVLAPGGRVAVQEFLLDEGKTSPPAPAFFSVHMLAVTSAGRAYTASEIGGMLRRAGFRGIRSPKADPRGVGVVTARA